MLKHGLRILFFAGAFMLFVVVGAHASCSNVVASATLLENGPAVHVTVVNPATCAALPVSELSITAPTSGVACPAGTVAMAASSPTKVSITADDTGLNFQAVPGATGMAICYVGIAFTDGTQVINNPFGVMLNSGVTATEFTTP